MMQEIYLHAFPYLSFSETELHGGKLSVVIKFSVQFGKATSVAVLNILSCLT
jgi:hypothetical protein